MKRDKKVAQQEPQRTYVGGNMVTETTGQEFLLTTIMVIYVELTRTAIPLSAITCFEHYCTRTAVGRR